ncbi:DUF58 domain-containing protein [Tautonia marina]|uniref:DUF58 domain-containing protein n=1 Tax=Tautonia marina TaxID=2653855 RepID=UPI001375C4DE|nr:DUF58 domain-containing protein [Tautonia marina]
MTTLSRGGAAPARTRSMWLRELRWARRLDPIVRHPLAVLGTATVAAVLCGLVLHPRGLALAGGLATVMALGVVWPWVSLRGLRGAVSFMQSRGREGQPVAARLEFRNRAPWGAWGLAIRFGSGTFDDPSPLAVAHVGGWRRGVVEWTFMPDRRGEHPVGGARLTTGFPFGLRESARSLAVERPVLIWPRTFPVGPIPEEAGGEASEGTSFCDRPGDAGDLLGVRPYRRGDPLRRVHWAQTARHGELIVCERQAAAVPRVQVVLDLDPITHVGRGPDGSLEWAIRVAASLLDDWIGQGAEAELVVGDRSLTAKGGTTAARRAAMLDAIARLDSEGCGPLADALDGPACLRFGRGLRVVVCTDRARLGGRDRPGATIERFAVLATTAFEEGGAAGSPINPAWPTQPWIVIDDPTRVPRQVWRQRKEIGDVR